MPRWFASKGKTRVYHEQLKDNLCIKHRVTQLYQMLQEVTAVTSSTPTSAPVIISRTGSALSLVVASLTTKCIHVTSRFLTPLSQGRCLWAGILETDYSRSFMSVWEIEHWAASVSLLDKNVEAHRH